MAQKQVPQCIGEDKYGAAMTGRLAVVMLVLADPIGSQWSDREIGRRDDKVVNWARRRACEAKLTVISQQ